MVSGPRLGDFDDHAAGAELAEPRDALSLGRARRARLPDRLFARPARAGRRAGHVPEAVHGRYAGRREGRRGRLSRANGRDRSAVARHVGAGVGRGREVPARVRGAQPAAGRQAVGAVQFPAIDARGVNPGCRNPDGSS
ncbi:hypothetical protein F01_170032 [Burkholderia cenocepacia]|nr:hypothetical protein F01_170032 [Burkholderia cenocepacia]